MKAFTHWPVVWCLLCLSAVAQEKLAGIVFILCDDHRFDALGVAGHPFLKTPNLDRLAQGGANMQRAYVTTSLCSPSRASILTGLTAHRHGVVDNYHPVDPSLVFFPQHLQRAGWQTAFIGKWHIGGETDEPQPGFNRWISFKGQGTYWPDGHGTAREVPQTTRDGLNVDGQRRPQLGYITDELTDFALEFLQERRTDQPFFLYVSHKAAHSDFVPADRHLGMYHDAKFIEPESLAPEALTGSPMWVQNQRNSRHGAEFGYNMSDFDLAAYYRRYCETLMAVDESVGRILGELERQKILDRTLVVYMGDNGFQFGEHGLIDKRTAYEASARVPMLLHCPKLISAGQKSDALVANIDIAPTLLAAAEAPQLTEIDGLSFWKHLTSGQDFEREQLLYEYYWERNYPFTPTLHAVIEKQWKYVRCHGIWDKDELYDLQSDPKELRNLINEPAHSDRVRNMNAKLWKLLAETKGEKIPLMSDRGKMFPNRHPHQRSLAPFPTDWLKSSE